MRNNNDNYMKRILKKLKLLKELYDFDIYDFSEDEQNYRYAYLLSCHKDNGFELRKALNTVMSLSDNIMVYIISNSFDNQYLKQIKKENLT